MNQTITPSRTVDMLVVGAGPAGMSAATAAAKFGKRVVILDDNRACGGQIWRDGVKTERSSAEREKSASIAALKDSGTEFLAGRCVVDAPQRGILAAVYEDGGKERIERFRWASLILATGARELFLPFPGWTLPGVFGAGGLQALAKSGLPVEGKRIVVAGSGPLLLAVAAYLQDRGAHIVSIAEQASYSRLLPFAIGLITDPSKLLQGARYHKALSKVPYRIGCWPVAAEGETALKSVRLTNGRRNWTEQCDYLACGFHLVPNTELASLLGCRIEDGFVSVDAQQRTSVENVYCAGETTGIAGLGAALVQGEIAGLVAAGEFKRATALYVRRDSEHGFGKRLDKAFRIRQEVRKLAAQDTLVCRCEDVPFGLLERYGSWTDAKLQTRCGMGPCQGRICSAATEVLFGWKTESVRPPIFPISVAALSDESSILTTQDTVLQEMPCNGQE
jgi:NADPH-dependent 2,4-dienoyl-CoA reductase/sulfur reductase-like enzyme